MSDESARWLAFSVALAVAQVAIALYVSRRGPRGSVSVAFAALGASLAAWTISTGIAHTPLSSDVAVRAAFASASLLLLSFVTFVSVFPSSGTPWHAWPYLLFLACGLAFTGLAFTTMVVAGSTYRASGLVVNYGPLYAPYGVYVGTALVVTLWMLTTKLRRARGREYLQLRYLAIALLVPAGAIAITNLLVPLVFGVSSLGRFGPAFSLVFLAVTAHAMIRERLMDIKLVVARSVSYAVAALITGAAFVTGCWLLATRFPDVFGGSLVLLVATAFALALVFHPATQRLRRVFDRYCYREPYNYNELVRRSSALLSSTVDLQQLLKHLFTLVRDSVRPEFMAAYLREIESTEFRLVAYDGDTGESAMPASIDSKAPLVERLVKGERLILGHAGDSLGREDASAWLRRVDGEGVYPIVHEGDVLAILLLGRKLSGDPYFAHDHDLLATITSQAAVAIKNAALYRHLNLLEGQRRRAERVAESGSLTAGIAHEIKNPLVAIRTFAELLPDRYEDAEFRTEFSRLVTLEIARLDRLVDRLRGVNGAPADDKRSLDVFQPLEETVALLSTQLAQAGIRVVRQYERGPMPVHGNADKLKQLFLNLLLNAAESMSGAGGDITVHLRRQRQLGAAAVTIEIEDQGPGIADEVRDTLFHPFVTTKHDSSGLGLWVCRRIADEHNAVLRIGNRQDEMGARVTIDIPVVDAVGVRPVVERTGRGSTASG